LLLISVLLTGCEHVPYNSSSPPLVFSTPDLDLNGENSGTGTTDFSSKGVSVSAPEDDVLHNLFSSVDTLLVNNAPTAPLTFSAPDLDERDAGATNFSSRNATLGSNEVITPLESNLKASVSEDDVLHGVVDSLLKSDSSAPLTFSVPDPEMDEDEGTTDFSSNLPNNDLFDNLFSSEVDQTQSTDNDLFDNVFSSEVDQTQSASQTLLTWSEKQEKIDVIKKSTTTSQKNNVIANQIRNKDVDTQLAIDLANIRKKEENIPIELAQTMKEELAHKVRLLNAETALKVAEVKMSALTKSNAIVARIEDRVLRAKSSISKGLVKEMFVSAPGEYYYLKMQSKKLQAKYQVDTAKAKLKYQQKLDVLNNDVKFLRDANKSIINTRIVELEEQRIAEALVVEQKIRAKNQAIVDQLYPEFKTELAEYIDTTNQRLERTEKRILDKLESDRLSEELARKTKRESDKRQYLSDVNKKIKKDQTDYKSKSRDRLISARDAKIESIVNNSERSVKRVKSNAVQALADLKAQNRREIQKQKSVLQVPYKKKKQVLSQKSQQGRSKVLSRSSAENYAILAKEKKEIGAINREIDTRVRAEIKAALDSFKGIKKDKVSPKTANTLEPEASSGFFSSWF